MSKRFLINTTGLLSLFILLLTAGCKHEEDIANTSVPVTPGAATGTPVNDFLQVTASVSGIVLDESNVPVANALVTSGTATTTTNTNGMFIFSNISLSKENGSVTVVKAGYFKGVRSFKATAGNNHTVRIKLMAKALSGTVNSAAGGTITSNGGATIAFPANAFATVTGAAYTGTVKVFSRWIDPTSDNLPFIIPGDLRGVDAAGAENILKTYGMVGAELEDAAGNPLKIAAGKKATISFPIPSALSAGAPATITLWHFDDATARWKENGTAAKAGNAYTAQVDQFSFWNCDIGTADFINLDYTILNAATNTPFSSVNTRIKKVSNGDYRYGIANNAGFVSGLVPKNEPLVLEVISSCNTVIYSQSIGPFASGTSLGNINATLPASQTLTITGTVLNCNAAPVSNGYVSLYITGGEGGYVATSATGTFSYSLVNCSGAALAYNYQAVDNVTTQQSVPFAGFASTGTINLGNINACGTTSAPNVYVAGSIGNAAVIWKNGIATYLTSGSITSPAAANSVFVSGTDVYVAGYEHSSWGDIAKVWKNGVATNLEGGLYPNGSAYDARANSVFVLGTDVYVAGNAANSARIWKNGVATTLAFGATQYGAEANSVFVSGTDVYVAGYETFPYPYNDSSAARVWKNGVSTNLTANGILNARAKSVFVSGTDVYVAGYAYRNGGPGEGARVWKNGIATILPNGTGNANSVFISGTDVYVAGNGGGNAIVWKNGIAAYLSSDEAKSIFVNGTDVYLAGTGYGGSGGNTAAKVWKNGLAINLSSGTTQAAANSVYVK
jgi:hypothetical protein